ncbi:O-antigen ligase [Bacillus sp. FDAARGOS_1420]|uniref:O-antigen ligase family protein n=1 Tax=unclassified Bacillus (in: firmicutes) TaxID=185979 RepID=UPI001C5BF571|nr:O-antigen ligase family protein [Bacillus sp. FDAARGOS_1420]MBW3491679.1 O-antigen ligase family protein [Bacillus sp. FDAARGOS_1420]
MAARDLGVISYLLIIMFSITVAIMTNKLVLMILPILGVVAIYLFFNMRKLIYLLVLFMPCIEVLNQYGVGFNIGSFQLMANSLVSSFFIMVAFLYLFKKNFEVKIYRSLFLTILVYISLGMISTIVATEKVVSLKEEIKLIFYFLLVLVIPFVINSESDKKKVTELFIAASIIPILIGAIQFLTNSSPIETYLDGRTVIRITGGFTHSNHFAYYISLVGIVLFTQILSSEKIVYYKSKLILFIIIALELFATYSRTALIMYALILIGILFSRKMSKLLISLPFILMGLVLMVNFGGEGSNLIEERFNGVLDIFTNATYVQDAMNNNYSDSFGWRIYLWSRVVALLFENSIIFGFGLQNFTTVANQAIGIYIDAHNTFIKVLIEMGILGFLAFMAFIVQMFIMYFKSKKKNLDFHISYSIYVYCYLILVSFVDPVFSHNVIGFYIWFFVGVQSILPKGKLE